MSITERQKAALTSCSPKTRNSNAPDPTWKAQQAFIRATRRGSKKHASTEEKAQLLNTALAAIPAPTKLAISPLDGKPTAPARMPVATPRTRHAVAEFLRRAASQPINREPKE